MGRRLAGWRALGWGDRWRLLACMAALPLLHASLATLGYKRTRRVIEVLSRRPAPRAASPGDVAAAQRLARLAAIAGRYGFVDATCLRQSLLLYGWLRRRGFDPRLQLGMKPDLQATFGAHAWVELDDQRLLPGDAGHRPFQRPGDAN